MGSGVGILMITTAYLYKRRGRGRMFVTECSVHLSKRAVRYKATFLSVSSLVLVFKAKKLNISV